MTDDVIELDGKLLPPIERTRLFLFHKPAGVVTTNRDPEGRKTVFDVLPTELPRLITIGRLDINTEGLLLLTNDGGLARVLELPATGWLRRYRVRVHGKVDESQLAGLKDGMAVDGVFYGAIEASLDREQGSNAWLTIGLREGKNREVKNILGSLGLDVTRLIRISFGPFQLGELAEGHVQELKGKLLRDQLGERLIEESGANFEADILKPFSNEPKRRDRDKPVEAVAPPRPLRDEPPVRIGEGGLIKRRQRREGTRDDALGKLSTQSERPRKARSRRPTGAWRRQSPTAPSPLGKAFGAKPFGAGKPARGGKKGEREQRPIEPPGTAQGQCLDGARRAADRSRQGGDRKGRSRCAQGGAQGVLRQAVGRQAVLRQAARRSTGRRPAEGGWPEGAAQGRTRCGSSAVSFAAGRIAAPRSQSIRPTTDRTREAVFNVLAHRFGDPSQGARVLDLFSGTGALGLEALSRGASFCMFIEESPEGRGLIRDNVEALRPDRADQDLPARRDLAWAGRYRAALRPGVRRSALWQGPRRDGRCARRAMAAGWCRARSAWWRRCRRRPSIRARAFPFSTSAAMARRSCVFCNRPEFGLVWLAT